MILELLEYLTTDCPRYARRLGYLKEAIAIRARQARLKSAWAPHLENSKDVIREAMDRCGRRRTALVLGSGLLLDIPLTLGIGRLEWVDDARHGLFILQALARENYLAREISEEDIVKIINLCN